jgi:hypothetical protein
MIALDLSPAAIVDPAIAGIELRYENFIEFPRGVGAGIFGLGGSPGREGIE